MALQRKIGCACPAAMPIAVLVESCNTELLQILRSCGISRILIKPFRLRDVVATIGFHAIRINCYNFYTNSVCT